MYKKMLFCTGGASERELNGLVQEMEMMKKFGRHDNVLSILGCCTQKGQSLFRYVRSTRLPNKWVTLT